MKSRKLVRDALGNERRVVELDRSAIGYRMEARDDGASAEVEAIEFTGHAAVFNERTFIGPRDWGFYEEIAPGAFDDVLEDDVRFLVNHDPNLLLARTTSGTLSLDIDKRGLATEAELAPTQTGRDLAVLLERGDISQMSFAFEVGADEWEELEDDDGNRIGELRTITRFKRLYDVSAVTYPAYAETDAALRAAGFDLLVNRLNLDDERVRDLLQAVDKREDPSGSSAGITADEIDYVQRHRHLATFIGKMA